MYDAIADCYDELIDADYYDKWFEFAAKLLNGKNRGVDVGCGSGAFAVELTKRGKDVVGIDESGAMLSKAMENARKCGLNIKFALGKAEDLLLDVKAEFVTAMNDVVNYMKNPMPFFKAAYECLTCGGMLLFDISSRYKLEKLIAGKTFFLQSDNFACVWENFPLTKKGALDMRLNIFRRRENGLYERKEETHRQYVHNEKDVEEMLKSVGFEVGIYADLTEKRPKGNSERIHFAAVKNK